MKGRFRTIAVIVIFGAYGWFLSRVGIVVAGGGHGTYLFLAFATSPLWFLIQAIPATPEQTDKLFTLIPFVATAWWATIAFLVNRKYDKVVPVLLVCHYLGIIAMLNQGDFDQLRKFHGLISVFTFNPLPLTGVLLLYFGGQIFLWKTYKKDAKAVAVQSRAI